MTWRLALVRALLVIAVPFIVLAGMCGAKECRWADIKGEVRNWWKGKV